MKKVMNAILVIVALTMGTSALAQTSNDVYKNGSVWTVGFIKTSANMSDDYLKNLKANWVAVHTEAVKQGLILSFKVLSGVSANPDDWDIMLLTEYKNLASMEGNEDKWDAIEKKVIGNDDAMKQLNQSRVSMRTIYGTKMLREIIYK
jgi:hypothetical protein